MNPIVALIIANIIWGAASPIFKYALTDIPPFTLGYIRFTFATIFFIPYVVTHWQKISMRDLITICLGAFAGITIEIGFYFLGLQRTESINAPIIISAGPIFLCLLAILFLNEKPNKKVLTGTFISLLGVLVIILHPLFLAGQGFKAGELQGNLFIVIATIGGVLHPLIYNNILRRINAFQVTAISFIFASFTFLPFMMFELRSWNFSMLHTPGWVGIIFGIVFSSAVGYFLYNYGVSRLYTQEVGIFNYIDPISAMMIAIPLLHEYPEWYFVAGAALVFGGIYYSEKRINYHPFHKLIKKE